MHNKAILHNKNDLFILNKSIFTATALMAVPVLCGHVILTYDLLSTDLNTGPQFTNATFLSIMGFQINLINIITLLVLHPNL